MQGHHTEEEAMCHKMGTGMRLPRSEERQDCQQPPGDHRGKVSRSPSSRREPGPLTSRPGLRACASISSC